MRRIIFCTSAVALTSVLTGCFEIGKFAAQHTLGARFGPCQSAKDSAEAALGKPYRRYFSDDEDVSEGVQVFWHEWVYAIPRDSITAVAAPDSAVAVPDSVRVVGFLWGHGVNGCSVRERRVLKGTHPSVPWQNAGDVPRVP